MGYGAVCIFDGEWEREGVDMAGSINTVFQSDNVAVLDGVATPRGVGTGRGGVLEYQRQSRSECGE
jgi:hypothetical protein